jgi:hypothetical protein
MVKAEVLKRISSMMILDQNRQQQNRLINMISLSEPELAEWAEQESRGASVNFDQKMQPYIANLVKTSILIGFAVAEISASDSYLQEYQNDSSSAYQMWLDGVLDDKFYVRKEDSSGILNADWTLACENRKARKEREAISAARAELAADLERSLKGISI